jgi:hypothetical protein
MEFAVFIWIICGVIAGAIASGNGRSFAAWFFLGILFGPLGVIGALIVGKDES